MTTINHNQCHFNHECHNTQCYRQTDRQMTADDDDDDDELIGYVHLVLQLKTVTSVLMIRSDEEFGFQITTERGWKMAAA